ncbi:hypothetical protein HanRHA438_Chr09g0416321 [Helianthus annuus]|nr:hypothetical protein HanIR_Chr09g0435781 [Helianthus annuus]KAJ0889760.1 hypothetical protein HanRHA438_Chr09g0416321 [Helianthus annuus]
MGRLQPRRRHVPDVPPRRPPPVPFSSSFLRRLRRTKQVGPLSFFLAPHHTQQP